MRISRMLVLAGCLASCHALPPSDLPVSAQRPTLASDTATTSAGSFELEAGGVWDPDELVDTPMSLKFGAGSATEVFLSGSPVLHLAGPGEDRTGPSDVELGLRHRFREETDGAPSAAVQATVKWPTANEDEGLGTGELDAALAGILTKGFRGYVVTGFYSLGVLGNPAGGTNVEHGVALGSTTPMVHRFGAFGELAGVFVPEQDSEQLFTTLGVTYNPASSLVFDLGVVLGLNDEAPDFQLAFGLTRNLGSPRSW